MIYYKCSKEIKKIMKRRELRGIAKAIAQNEKVLSDPKSTSEARGKAMQAIMDLTEKFDSLEDMAAVDELVQDMLASQS
jgi:hypothetical protein